MQRTQIYLEPELAQSLDQLARERGTSRAAVIREAARALVERGAAAYGSILDLAGIGHSGFPDISVRHDDYLVEDEIAGWSG